MEELLNKLIEKGWKPFGDGRIVPYVKIDYRQIAFYKSCDDGMYQWLFDTDIRTVLSKESGLRQFVCENGMTTLQIEYNNRKTPERGVRYHWNKHSNVMQENERLTKERKRNENYEYRLIESTLRDESELEDFLLDNIKV